MLSIGKKKLIANYEKQLKNKSEYIDKLVKSNKELMDHNTNLFKENNSLRKQSSITEAKLKQSIFEIHSKEISRLEVIKARTRKERTKKKIENRILDIKEYHISYKN